MCNVKKRLSLEKQIAITIFLLGIILSIMIPTGQTPDEYSHLNMIGNSCLLYTSNKKVVEVTT